MKTTLPLAVLFAAVMAVGLWVGNAPRLGIPFQTLLVLHITMVCVTIALVLYADEQAALGILGKKEYINARVVRFLHYAIALGLAAIIATGALLFLPAPAYYFGQSVFIIKMVAIAALILNTYVIDRFSGVALTRSFASLTLEERVPLFISGAVSLLGWITALICALLIT